MQLIKNNNYNTVLCTLGYYYTSGNQIQSSTRICTRICLHSVTLGDSQVLTGGTVHQLKDSRPSKLLIYLATGGTGCPELVIVWSTMHAK